MDAFAPFTALPLRCQSSAWCWYCERLRLCRRKPNCRGKLELCQHRLIGWVWLKRDLQFCWQSEDYLGQLTEGHGIIDTHQVTIAWSELRRSARPFASVAHLLFRQEHVVIQERESVEHIEASLDVPQPGIRVKMAPLTFCATIKRSLTRAFSRSSSLTFALASWAAASSDEPPGEKITSEA